MSPCRKEKKTPLRFEGARYADFEKCLKDRNMKGGNRKEKEERSVYT